jgi:CubicO group peptidase (beta-lactamase class C family)
VFRDDNAGQDIYWWGHPPYNRDAWSNWIAYNVNEGQYEAFRDGIKKSAFYPTCIQGSVIGPNNPPPQYAVIFGRRDRPYDRQWTVTGNGSSSLAGIDEVIKNFMQHDGIRAGVFVIADAEGKIKLLHGYTWAERDIGYPITQPDSLFRIASISKMFTCAAIQKLYDDKLLYPNTKVFPTLKLKDSKSSPAVESPNFDERINDIEVQHLVAHLGGWNRAVAIPDPGLQQNQLTGDPVFAIRNIALRLRQEKQLTKEDFARYMYGQPLQFTPGDTHQPPGVDTYSNFGYVLLGMLVEKVDRKNRNFIDFLREEVLAPINVPGVFLARTLPSQAGINEVLYDDSRLGLSAVDWPGRSYASDDLVPFPHGGAGFSTEIMDSGGGLMSTAQALVQFARRYPVDGIGKGRSPKHAGRSGGMPGTDSLVVSRGDGVDYAYIFNRNDPPQGPGRVNLTEKINEFLHDKTI